MKVVIFGCGRTGAALGLQLRSLGKEVVFIEQNPEAIVRLGADHGCEIIIGSGLDENILAKSGVEDADAFFALTRGDNTNIMAAQVVKMRYNTPKICIKVSDPLRADAYRKLGYICINPPTICAGMMLDWVRELEYKTIDAYNALPKELEL